VKYIDRIGLEVEGGWPGKPRIPPFEDLTLVADHSIDGTTLPTDKPLTSTHVGEAVSLPLPMEEVEEWLTKYWPKETNRTCGYHIHISLRSPFHYMLLTKKAYAILLRKRMWALGLDRGFPKTHYLFARLSGDNPFCTFNFDASGQMNIREKRVGMRLRYGFLNFAKNIHGTVEFRALPTFDNVADAKAFTFEFLNVTEEFLERELLQVSEMKRTLSLTACGATGHKIEQTRGDKEVCA
jgi:hypothetical protein